MDGRTRRIGENEDLFRRVNEQIEALNEGFALLASMMTMVCECGNLTCVDQIEIPIGEYDRLRSEPTWFAIKPGHEIGDVETVVERHEGYEVVAKRAGEPARIARELDPRRKS
jgi:hypothetical protein